MNLTTAERSARYRAKNVEAYRKRKRELARTPHHKKVRAAYMRRWRKKQGRAHTDWTIAYNVARRKSQTPDERHDEYLRWRYGITYKQYKKMLRAQGYRCAICRCKGTDRRWHVDHCHTKKFIRGLLCSRCNGQFGWFEKHRRKITQYGKPFRFVDGYVIKKSRDRRKI